MLNKEDMLFDLVNNQLAKRIDEELTDIKLKAVVSECNGFFNLDDLTIEQITHRLLTMYEVSMEKGAAITDSSTRDRKWFTEMKMGDDFGMHYKRFIKYMSDEKGWNHNVLSKLDSRTTDIMNFLGDPNEKSKWFKKGLLIGDVQSGKTINYTAICNKASDAGYKVIILLTGTIENLRKQTQVRLETDYIGRRVVDINDLTQSAITGVGKYNPSLDVTSFTSSLLDFRKSFAQQNSLSLRSFNGTAVFVIKKNKSVLDSLNAWLKAYNLNGENLIDLPLLVIDDESDYASVNTKDIFNPTTINAGIRMLLNNFTRKSYIAVTATPFANIFIDDEAENDMMGVDLFPENFIYLLEPPSNYIGAVSLFGDLNSKNDKISLIDDEYTEFTHKHKKDDEVELPIELHEALYYFVISNAVMNYKDILIDKHRTMLINMSRFINTQNQIHDQVLTWLDTVKMNVMHFSKRNESELANNTVFRNFVTVWEKYNFSEKHDVDWKTIKHEHLWKSTQKIETRVVNQRSQVKLDYNAYNNGLSVIAIGGNSLSRGLTLEGLFVTYFYRNSKMYDTLMQMGRWFGYRDGYDSFVMIWMTEETVSWYQHINEATEELKDEVRRMRRLDLTPKEFGLMVKQHPDTLIITARNKMKHTTDLYREIDYSGKLVETPKLRLCKKSLENNMQRVEEFINSIDYDKNRHDDKVYASSVSHHKVTELLDSFRVHPTEMKFRSNILKEYISGNSEFHNWDIYIPSVTSGDKKEKLVSFNNGEQIIFQSIRTTKIKNDALLVSGTKARVGTQGLTKVGIRKEDSKRLESEFKVVEQNKNKSIPDSVYLNIERNPILIIHFINPRETIQISDTVNCDQYVALSIGFPKCNGTNNYVNAKYRINNVELRNILSESQYSELEGDDLYEDE